MPSSRPPPTPIRSESAPLLTPSRSRPGSRHSSRPTSPTTARKHSARRKSPPVHVLPAVVAVVLFALIALTAWDVSRGCSLPWLCDALGGPRESFEKVWWRNTGPYAAYRSLGHGGGNAHGLPEGCRVDQVSILHRHTGRYPTPNAAEHLKTTLAKLANRAVRVPTNHPDLHFLHNVDLELNDWIPGELTNQGRLAAWDSGKVYAARYRSVSDHAPFVRSSGGHRVVESAQFFLEGFYGREFNLSHAALQPDVVIPEGEGVNNTLSVHSCAAFEALDPPAGSKQRAAVAKLLQPTADRLNRLLGPRPELETEDVRRIADMCGYDTTAKEVWSGWSKWCKMLSRDEWEIAGYMGDVERWYRVGEGGRFGKIMGAGYVNELLARLQDKHPHDHTTTNRTLDADPATFPPGGQRVFVDFTHDNEMIEILTALGIRKMRRKLPTSELPDDPTSRRYVLSELIPFGARWAFERVSCDPYVDVGRGTPAAKARRVGEDDARRSTFVRALINDRPSRIDHMACRSSPLQQYHLCDLDSFIESQEWAITDVDWHDCRVKKK